jgi:hypothetical protein
MRAIQERVGTALWGGNPVPGTASTLGMRIGSSPRLSVSGRAVLVPAELPPLLDRSGPRGARGWIPGCRPRPRGRAAGVVPAPHRGRRPVPGRDRPPGRGAAAPGRGFERAPRRLVRRCPGGPAPGVLHPARRLPHRVVRPQQRGDVRGPGAARPTASFAARVSDLNATLAVSQRSAGPAHGGGGGDRYTHGGPLGYHDAWATRATGPGHHRPALVVRQRRLDLPGLPRVHGAGLAGDPRPAGCPPASRLDPVGWWAGVAFRVSI